MIDAIAVVPSAAHLLADYTGRIDAGADLRADCVRAVRTVCRGAEDVVLVTATDRKPRHTRAALGVRVGQTVLSAAGACATRVVEVAWDASTTQCRALGRRVHDEARTRHTALVVVADGSARRGEKAPGHLDPRSFELDDSWVDALRRGDGEALLRLDPNLAADLLMAGRAPVQVMAEPLLDNGFRCDMLRDEDPLGVRYVVAVLTRER